MPPPPEENSVRQQPMSEWEKAYVVFETREQELAKFQKRLRQLGVTQWNKNLKIVELMCGRGTGLKAWESLGFKNLEGLDFSANLLALYQGPAKLYTGDVRALPFENHSRDVLTVQGGLHHLVLMNDLEKALDEIHRVLKPDGKLLLVEPWLTPFLRFVHFVSEKKLARKCSKKIWALGTMIDHERDTYEAWLSSSDAITKALNSRFKPQYSKAAWGKLMMVASPRL